MSSRGIGYRSDIEGLRAVAILLVILAHASVPGFDGGFIGVDIFFVISGYLITGILLREQRESSRIDLPMFYARRLRRLLPALAVMLLFTLAMSWVLLPAEDQQEQGIAGAAAALWLSNLHFAVGDVDYFAPRGDSNIYLHTWSLGVEEQFYLLWPLLLSWLLLRRGAGSRRDLLPIILVAVAVLGLALCWWLTRTHPQQAFYLMPTRAWQFAVGAMVFLASGVAPRAAGPLSVLGVMLILGGLLLIDGDTPYPGLWAMLPTMGAACLLHAGVHGSRTAVARLLSTRPSQFVGRISYSWYLWHWPLLVLGGVLLPMWKPESRLLVIGLSLVMAVMSYRWVEAPLRRNDRILRRPYLFLGAALGAMLLLVFAQMWWAHAAFEDSLDASARQAASRHYAVTWPSIYREDCDDWHHSDVLTPCFYGNAGAEKTAIVMGDSVGLQWFPALERIFPAPQWRLIVLTKSACPIVDRPIHYARIGREYVECEVWRDRAAEYVVDAKPDVLVMGSAHYPAYTQDDWIAGTRSVLSRVAPHADAIFILRATPQLPFHGARCAESAARFWGSSHAGACSAPDRDERGVRVAGWITGAAEAFENVSLIDMNDLVCPDGICSAIQNGSLVYRDKMHLNAEYAAGLAEPMARRMGMPLSGAQAP